MTATIPVPMEVSTVEANIANTLISTLIASTARKASILRAVTAKARVPKVQVQDLVQDLDLSGRSHIGAVMDTAMDRMV